MKFYKNIIIALILLINTFSLAQTAIGKTSLDSTKSIMEFPDNEGMAIILPWAEALPTGTTLRAGTLLYDMSSETEMRVKYFDGTNWQDLTNKSDLTNTDRTNLLTVRGNAAVEDVNGAKIEGTTSNAVDGTLVLTDNTKALTLPRETSYKNIKSPSPGTMVYDTTAKMICFYNGSTWSFWGHKL